MRVRVRKLVYPANGESKFSTNVRPPPEPRDGESPIVHLQLGPPWRQVPPTSPWPDSTPGALRRSQTVWNPLCRSRRPIIHKTANLSQGHFVAHFSTDLR
ncbi:Hypothetical protein NTJ_08022 [Nesidiocoris tenuis]|uniref:Uncharacterized protein n=1 Tax=Nesidiocoris tenuis TaxID=355587 RepID=A0ABN7ATD9_9HEMI|nr:Hypothetical protein NTJ_08022 [Nesidiocoris tenuis]